MTEMKRVQYNYLKEGTKFSYEYEETITSGNASQWVVVPSGITNLVLTLDCSATGSGKIQTTNDTHDRILNNTALAFDWRYGTISTSKENSFRPIKAFRAYRVSGTIRIIGSAQ